MRKYLLPEEGSFYKANLHCHSTVSDGRWSPERIKQEYMAKGYSVIAYTDHDVLIPHPELTDEHFVALSGYEMEIDEVRQDGKQGKTCHMCLIALEPDNVKQVCWHRSRYLFGNARNYREQVQFHDASDYERSFTHECISDMMRRGREAGFYVTYNHPVWSLEDFRDYSGYEGMHAMEICNWGCVVEGYNDYVPQVYDDLLRLGRRIYCIGADDNHNRSEVGSPDCDSGWAFTMIKADSLGYSDITKALVEGNFYASEAPEIYELYVEDGEVHIKCSPAARITITYDVRLAFALNAPKGETVTEAAFKTHYDYGWFRLTVTDREGKRACTNAYYFDDFKN